MASSVSKITAVAVLLCMMAAAPYASAAITCSTVARALSPCIAYAKGSGGTPPVPCCQGIRGLVAQATTTPDRQAACRCLKNLSGSIPNVNMGTVAKSNKEFVEEVKGQNKKLRRLGLEAYQEFKDWFSKTLVAELKSIRSGESIENEMSSEGIAFVKVIPSGGRSMLIQFACEADLDKCLSEDYRSVRRIFSKLQRWREEVVASTRSVWVSILGLPFRAWTDENCVRLAEPHGVFLKMDDRDVRFVGVRRARMQIETSKVERILETLEVVISDKLYEIKLCEECCLGGCELNSPQSSESSESSGDPPSPRAVSHRSGSLSKKDSVGQVAVVGRGEAFGGAEVSPVQPAMAAQPSQATD
ncbi:unnamed protein product [Rhodiola kirilowii]